MKHLLLVATVLGLVLTGCGGHKSAAPTSSGTMVLPVRSVQAVATAREHEAARRAERLLRRIVLPSGVIRLSGPPVSSGSVLLHPGGTVSTLTKFAYRHAFWSVRLPLSSVDSFVKAHPTAGLKWLPGGSTQGPGVAANAEEDFHGQLVGGRPMQRLLSITMARLNGTTVIRVDAGAAWVYPRSPREVVPSGVHEIDIANSTASRRVTNPAKVPRIIRWFDMLSIVQPGVRVPCPLLLASTVTFVFRSANGAELASGIVPSRPATGCNPIAFSIRGREQTPLIDSTPGAGKAFIDRVQRLLGVHFAQRP